MRCGICGRELDENGHCIPCERRAEWNKVRELSQEENAKYSGVTIFNESDSENSKKEQKQNMSYGKVYKIDLGSKGIFGNFFAFVILILFIAFALVVVFPLALTGIVISVVIGFIIGIWRHLKK